MERPGNGSRWKNLKKDQILIGILVGILLLVIAFPNGEKQENAVKQQDDGTTEIIQQDSRVAWMEMKLQNILQQVEGVGKTRVMITVKSFGKKTVEKDSSLSEDSEQMEENRDRTSVVTEETTIYQRDGEGNEIPFVVEETAPVVEGVLVAAQGGDNLVVAEKIADAAQVLFGVDAHKIKVMKLN